MFRTTLDAYTMTTQRGMLGLRRYDLRSTTLHEPIQVPCADLHFQPLAQMYHAAQSAPQPGSDDYFQQALPHAGPLESSTVVREKC